MSWTTFKSVAPEHDICIRIHRRAQSRVRQSASPREVQFTGTFYQDGIPMHQYVPGSIYVRDFRMGVKVSQNSSDTTN
jgi:hypothetical protein